MAVYTWCACMRVCVWDGSDALSLWVVVVVVVV